MITILFVISMIASLGMATLALVAAAKQPEKAKQFRGVSALFFGFAGVTALAFFI